MAKSKRAAKRYVWQREQREFVRQIFEAASELGWDNGRLRRESTLCAGTVLRYSRGDYKFPQYRTLSLLAGSVGMEYRLVEKK